MIIQWCDDRDTTAKEADRQYYVGIYSGHGTRIEKFPREETGKLAFTLNSNIKSQCDLEFYKDDCDVYSFFPVSRDVWLTRSMRGWDYYMVGLVGRTRPRKSLVGFTSSKIRTMEVPLGKHKMLTSRFFLSELGNNSSTTRLSTNGSHFTIGR